MRMESLKVASQVKRRQTRRTNSVVRTPLALLLPLVGVALLVGCLSSRSVGDSKASPSEPSALGSFTVLIAGMPAARLGDTTAHGGTVECEVRRQQGRVEPIPVASVGMRHVDIVDAVDL